MERNRLKIFGIGGGGSNLINRSLEALNPYAEVWTVNTDANALAISRAERRLLLGPQLTRGLGAGGNPTIAQAAATESQQALLEAVVGADVVLICAGLGGGTGTGGSPVLAAIAREAGAFALALVSSPFTFEGRRRTLQAEAGLSQLTETADCVVSVRNDALMLAAPGHASMQEASAMLDAIAVSIAREISAIATPAPRWAIRTALSQALAASPLPIEPPWERPTAENDGGPSGFEPTLQAPDRRTGLEPSL